MQYNEITLKLFSIIESHTKQAILENVSAHYGITTGEALLELVDPEAEHLLDYLTGSARAAAKALMQRNGLA
jgi:hypothetical protein